MCFYMLECHSGDRFKSEMHSAGPDWNRKIFMQENTQILWYLHLSDMSFRQNVLKDS